MSHTAMCACLSRCRYIDESCPIWRWGMSLTWITRLIHMCDFSHITHMTSTETCTRHLLRHMGAETYGCDMTSTETWHAHMGATSTATRTCHVSHHTYEWVMSHITHTNESCLTSHTRMSHLSTYTIYWDMHTRHLLRHDMHIWVRHLLRHAHHNCYDIYWDMHF